MSGSEVHVLLPVIRDDIVLACAHVISHVICIIRSIYFRHPGSNAGQTEQAVYRCGMPCCKVFSLRIRPSVLDRTCYIEGTWRCQSGKPMLVCWKVFLLTLVLVKFPCEPMRERGCDDEEILSELSARNRSSATSGIIGYDHIETRICSSCPECSLSKT